MKRLNFKCFGPLNKKPCKYDFASETFDSITDNWSLF